MFLQSKPCVVAIALLGYIHSVSADGQCFLPNGKIDGNDVPCFSEDGKSRCCAPDEFCSTNKLCISKVGQTRFARGSCLDRAYGETCPNFCQGINDAAKVDLFQCGDPALGQFCCDEGKGNDCCAKPSKILTLGIGSTFPEGSLPSSSGTLLAMSQMPVPQARSSTTSLTSGSSSFQSPATTSSVASSTSLIFKTQSTTMPTGGLTAAPTPSPDSSTVLSTSIAVLTSVASAISTNTVTPDASSSSQIFMPSIAFSLPFSSTSAIPAISGAAMSSEADSPNSSPFSSLTQYPQPTVTLNNSVPAESELQDSPAPSQTLDTEKSGITTPVKIGVIVGVATILGLLVGLSYYHYLLQKNRRFSRRFERSLSMEKVDKASKRGSGSSWASKASWTSRIGLKGRGSSDSPRPMNISIPIKATQEGGWFGGQEIGRMGDGGMITAARSHLMQPPTTYARPQETGNVGQDLGENMYRRMGHAAIGAQLPMKAQLPMIYGERSLAAERAAELDADPGQPPKWL